ncbi:hypothetical protein Tco_0691932 [Tanacetum coccineum]
MFWHYARDDFMSTTIRVISKHKDTQEYDAILPQHLTNQTMLESEAFKTYHAYATSEKVPKLKATKKKTYSESSPITKPTQASKGKKIKTSAKGDKPAKTKSKGLIVLSEVALSKAEQMKLATKQSLIEFHISHASGSGNGVYLQSEVPDEQQLTGSGTNKRAGDKPEVPDVPEYRSESKEESWTFSQGENEDEDDENNNDEDDDEHETDDEDNDQVNNNQRTDSDDDGDNFVHPKLSTFNEDDQEEDKDEEKANDDEDENQDDDYVMGGEQEDEEDEELYSDLNINLNRRDAEMTDPQVNRETGEVHVTLTTEPPVVQQQSSSVSSDLVSKFINPSPDTDSTTTTTIPTSVPEILNFASLFGFERRVYSLEIELSEFKQTNQFAEALSSIPGIVDKYLASKMKDEVNVAVQLKSNKLREEAQAENDEFLKQIDSNINNIINDQVKGQVSKILPKIEKYVTYTLKGEVLRRSSNQPQSSYTAAASLIEFELKKILIEKIEENKSMNRSDIQKNLYNTLIESYKSEKYILTSYGEVVTLKRGRDDQDKDEEPSAGSNRGSPPKSLGKSTQEEEHEQRVDDLEEPFHQEFNIGNDDVSLAREVHSPSYYDNTPTGEHITGGPKRQRFYGYATNMETSKDVYSKHRIIVVTSLKIMKFFCYKHLEEIKVRRQDDKLYKFREGDFKRLRRKDIEDMLLLLVQGKLTNLNVDERFALNVALRMYTRRIVIQERVEDLQLAVESYQKKINLTKPDTYRTDLRKMTPYTAYRDIQGIIYQDDMDINRLMRIDELYKFIYCNTHSTTKQNSLNINKRSNLFSALRLSEMRQPAEFDESNTNVNPHGFEGNLKMENTSFLPLSLTKFLLISYGDVVTLKRGRDDQDKDEEPSARWDDFESFTPPLFIEVRGSTNRLKHDTLTTVVNTAVLLTKEAS